MGEMELWLEIFINTRVVDLHMNITEPKALRQKNINFVGNQFKNVSIKNNGLKHHFW